MNKIPLVLILIILAVFTIPTYIAMGQSDLATPPPEWVEACQWVKDNTPENSLIVAWWDYGYWIRYISGRQAYATPGQYQGIVKPLAENFLSYSDNVQWPDGQVYLMVDRVSVYDFQRSMATWAGLDYLNIAYERTLIYRLYTSDVPGYRLVKDGQIKVLEVER